jgi:hypothetical protein
VTKIGCLVAIKGFFGSCWLDVFVVFVLLIFHLHCFHLPLLQKSEFGRQLVALYTSASPASAGPRKVAMARDIFRAYIHDKIRAAEFYLPFMGPTGGNDIGAMVQRLVSATGYDTDTGRLFGGFNCTCTYKCTDHHCASYDKNGVYVVSLEDWERLALIGPHRPPFLESMFGLLEAKFPFPLCPSEGCNQPCDFSDVVYKRPELFLIVNASLALKEDTGRVCILENEQISGVKYTLVGVVFRVGQSTTGRFHVVFDFRCEDNT